MGRDGLRVVDALVAARRVRHHAGNRERNRAVAAEQFDAQEKETLRIRFEEYRKDLKNQNGELLFSLLSKLLGELAADIRGHLEPLVSECEKTIEELSPKNPYNED